MINIDNLTFGYNNNEIIKDLNLEINDQDYIAIIGGNGTGKSTLIKCILGINKINKNMISIDDVDINKFNDFKKIGYVQQLKNDKSDIPISGIEYLRLFTKDKQKIQKLIKDLSLEEFINDNIHVLSGGQRQRINIAKSMINDIKYLILDEPNTGLDVENRRMFYDLLAKLNSQGITIIIVSHHIDEISCKINKVYNLEKNELEEVDRDGCQYC